MSHEDVFIGLVASLSPCHCGWSPSGGGSPYNVMGQQMSTSESNAEGKICGCQRLTGKVVHWILFCSVGVWRGGGVINLLCGGNSIRSSYSSMQSAVWGAVSGHRAESRRCLHSKPNFQFSPAICLHSH